MGVQRATAVLLTQQQEHSLALPLPSLMYGINVTIAACVAQGSLGNVVFAGDLLFAFQILVEGKGW